MYNRKGTNKNKNNHDPENGKLTSDDMMEDDLSK